MMLRATLRFLVAALVAAAATVAVAGAVTMLPLLGSRTKLGIRFGFVARCLESLEQVGGGGARAVSDQSGGFAGLGLTSTQRRERSHSENE